MELLRKMPDIMNSPIFDLLSKSDHADLRKATRDDVAICADVRVPTVGRNKVRVLDLSQTGFCMESLTLLPDDRAIFLTIRASRHWKQGSRGVRSGNMDAGFHAHYIQRYSIIS